MRKIYDTVDLHWAAKEAVKHMPRGWFIVRHEGKYVFNYPLDAESDAYIIKFNRYGVEAKALVSHHLVLRGVDQAFIVRHFVAVMREAQRDAIQDLIRGEIPVAEEIE